MLSLRERLFLLIIAGFLILGNLPRFLPMPTAFGNVNFSEVLLYQVKDGTFYLCIKDSIRRVFFCRNTPNLW